MHANSVNDSGIHVDDDHAECSRQSSNLREVVWLILLYMVYQDPWVLFSTFEICFTFGETAVSTSHHCHCISQTRYVLNKAI